MRRLLVVSGIIVIVIIILLVAFAIAIVIPSDVSSINPESRGSSPEDIIVSEDVLFDTPELREMIQNKQVYTFRGQKSEINYNLRNVHVENISDLNGPLPFSYQSKNIPVDKKYFLMYKSPVRQKIPRKIVQTNKYSIIPEAMKLSIDNIRKFNPEYKHRYYDDIDCEKFIRKHYSEREVKCFNSLLPGAYRADFFRTCYLLKKGGVYIDTGFVEIIPLREVISSDDILIVAEDNCRSTDKQDYIYNAFLACESSNPVLEEALKLMIENIENKRYTEGIHGITGPLLYGKAFRNIVGKLKVGTYQSSNGTIKVWQSLFFEDCDCCILSNHLNPLEVRLNPIFYSKYFLYRREQQDYNREYYAESFNNRRVYGNYVYKPPTNRSFRNSEIKFFSKTIPLYPIYETIEIFPQHPRTIVFPQESFIPKTIVQTNAFNFVPRNMYSCIKTLIYLNPEYDYFYFDDDRARKFISSYYPKRTLKAFDSLVPGAYKSDFFRICFLLKRGGVYIDTSQICNIPLREFLNYNDKFVSPEDNYCTITRGHPHLYNAFIASEKNHPILRRCLEKMVKNIEHQDYSKTDLGITGPRCLGEAFTEIIDKKLEGNRNYGNGVRTLQSKYNHHTGEYYTTDGKCYGDLSDRILIQNKYKCYYQEKKKYTGDQIDYRLLFREKRVFR